MSKFTDAPITAINIFEENESIDVKEYSLLQFVFTESAKEISIDQAINYKPMSVFVLTYSTLHTHFNGRSLVKFAYQLW